MYKDSPMYRGKYKDSVILQAVRENWGSTCKAGAVFNVSPGAVCKWLKEGYVSLARAREIEELTGGKYRMVDMVNSKNRKTLKLMGIK